MFNAQGIWLLAALGGVVWGWLWLSRMRERALSEAKRLCAELPAQCLDESVVLTSLKPRALLHGAQRIETHYAFEFSLAGHDRYRGELMLARGRLQWARLEHPEGTVYVDGARVRARGVH